MSGDLLKTSTESMLAPACSSSSATTTSPAYNRVGRGGRDSAWARTDGAKFGAHQCG